MAVFYDNGFTLFLNDSVLNSLLANSDSPKDECMTPIDVDTFPFNTDIQDKFCHLIDQFVMKKGQLQQAYFINPSVGTQNKSIPQVFVIPDAVKVYCVCETGLGPSQIVHSIIKKKAYRTQFVEPPHGSTGALDPFINVEDRIDVESFPVRTPYAYAKLPEAKADIFGQLMKTYRVPRLLEDFLTPDFNPAPYDKNMIPRFEKAYLARINLRIMFDSIFDEAIKHGAVFFIFNKALHVTMYRLLERAKILKRDLDKIVIYPILADDPIVKNNLAEAQNFVDIFSQAIVFN